jgi:bifunctional DNA-binding transcriptional regulator/antitoxin component of YhaV-PrlF toxin-antitoxin module
MLTKITSKNQITLPKALMASFKGVEYFEISADGDLIQLRPLRRSRLDEVRQYLAQLEITEQDVTDAVAWARGQQGADANHLSHE